MIKFHLLTLLALICTLTINAQNFYWVGPSTGASWNASANWSSSSNGPGGAGVPNSSSHNVIFDRSATINVNLATIALNSLTVNSGITTNLYTGINSTIQISGTSNGLTVGAGATLIDSSTADVDFITDFLSGAKALINGTWRFANSGALFAREGAGFRIPTTAGLGNLITVNGTMAYGPNTVTRNYLTGTSYLLFNAGSFYHLQTNGGGVPIGSWDQESTILIEGNTTAGTTIHENNAIGNLIYNSAQQSAASVSLSILSINIQGDLEVQNTNSRDLVLVGNFGVGPGQTVQPLVSGNLTVTGNSRVVLSDLNSSSISVDFTVAGDLTAAGESFNIQKNGNNSITNNPTVLRVGGNIIHSSGTFTASAAATSDATELYILELNGSSHQTIQSVTGNFDNAANQVTLRMNNSSGATLLTPLSIGRLNFSSSNGGVLTTSTTNILTINNGTGNALTVSGPSDAGFVNGPVRVRTAATALFTLPTGKGSEYRPIHVQPSTNAASVYEGEYMSTGYSDLSVAAPLRAVSSAEHWLLTRISGSDAAVHLTVDGVIPDAIPSDAIVVARYNGAAWENAAGSTGTYIIPGTSSSGTVISEALSSFDVFTFGLTPQTALPIFLVDFNAKKIAPSKAEVKWEITTNSTPQRFEVMKSINGRDFTLAGVLTAVEGQTDYSFVDEKLAAGTTYYRLRMYDIDGSYKLTKIVAVLNGANGILITSMAPTVVTSMSNLSVTSSRKGNLQIVVTDILGRVVMRTQAGIGSGNQTVPVNLSQLSSGTFQLTGYFEGQRVSTIRFIKQ